MKIQFTLDITGIALFDRFAAAIDEEGVGQDNEGECHATLSEDGRTWTTYWSGFTYTIVNPAADKPAVVEYDGACRGFLNQNLIPGGLKGETIHAEVVEGSALERHGVERFVHQDASILAEAYGLMQGTTRDFRGRDVLGACFRAIENARKISRHMAEIGIQDSWVNAGNGPAVAAANIEEGDPVIQVTCCHSGRQVTGEFPVDVTPFGYIVHREGHSLPESADRAKAWIDRLML